MEESIRFVSSGMFGASLNVGTIIDSFFFIGFPDIALSVQNLMMAVCFQSFFDLNYQLCATMTDLTALGGCSAPVVPAKRFFKAQKQLVILLQGLVFNLF